MWKQALNSLHVLRKEHTYRHLVSEPRQLFHRYICCSSKTCFCVAVFLSLHLSLNNQGYLNWHTLCIVLCAWRSFLISVHQPMEVLLPTVRQSLAADFDQVSSFGQSATLPDNSACYGNRKLKVSRGTGVALSVHTWLHFYSWPSQTLWWCVLTHHRDS